MNICSLLLESPSLQCHQFYYYDEHSNKYETTALYKSVSITFILNYEQHKKLSILLTLILHSFMGFSYVDSSIMMLVYTCIPSKYVVWLKKLACRNCVLFAVQ